MANFGESLKRERELRDIPLRDIANATKINLRYLEALEGNRFDILPGGVFNKGFIRAYARFIGADGEALVQRYVEEMAQREAAIASTHPTPDRPGLMRPAEAPPRRRTDPADGASPAEPGGMPITFAEGRAATSAVAAMAAARRGAPRAATVPFEAGSDGHSKRLVLAATTVIAAFAALGIVLYLVRSARHDAGVPASAREEAPATGPTGSEGIADDPAGEASGDDGATPDAPGVPTVPDGAAPPADAPGTNPSPAPAPQQQPPQPKLPDVPRERDGKTPPVRVASPIPAPPQDPAKPAPRPTAPLPPQQSPQQAPQQSPSQGAGNDSKPPAPSGPMTLLVQGVKPVMVQLGCDGVDRPARQMTPGEVVTLRCYSLVRISTEDAGAVRLSLDGAACAPLGASGSRVEHYTIRAEDARAICPPGGAGDHGRR